MNNKTITRHALLVGSGDYQQHSELPNLRTPCNDARKLGAVLSEAEDCKFQAIIQENPDCKQFEREVERIFKKAGPDDMVLFYFSGHGKLSPEGGLHLCATDTDVDLLDSTTVSLSWLSKNIIDKTRAAQVIVLLDCCYSGAALGSFKGDVPSVLQTNLGQGHGKYLVTSSTAIQPSIELSGDENSLFTKWLIRGIETWEADLGNDNILTVEEWYRYAVQQIEREQPSQRPQRWGFGVTPDQMIIARRQEVSGPATPLKTLHPDFFIAVRPLFEDGQVIPFLGEGIFGSGPLSSFALTGALAVYAGLKADENYSMATAAEYLERLLDDRQRFVRQFRKILNEQGSLIKPTASHQLVAQMEPPWFVVSATYDNVLEKHLEETHKPFIMVSHILHSFDGEHDGKILVVHCGKEKHSEILLADELILGESERVIYKVLGTPFIDECTDPALALDTMVITETDHTKFLANLDNQHTKVPEAFSLPFRTSSLLFLGYNLDTWHYRLVAQVFGRHGYARTSKRPYAVRQPTSPIEELFWERLDANLIHSDVEGFARTMLQTEEA